MNTGAVARHNGRSEWPPYRTGGTIELNTSVAHNGRYSGRKVGKFYRDGRLNGPSKGNVYAIFTGEWSMKFLGPTQLGPPTCKRSNWGKDQGRVNQLDKPLKPPIYPATFIGLQYSTDGHKIIRNIGNLTTIIAVNKKADVLSNKRPKSLLDLLALYQLSCAQLL